LESLTILCKKTFSIFKRFYVSLGSRKNPAGASLAEIDSDRGVSQAPKPKSTLEGAQPERVKLLTSSLSESI